MAIHPLLAAGAGLGAAYLLTKKKEEQPPLKDTTPANEEKDAIYIDRVMMVTRRELSPQTISLITMADSCPEGKQIQSAMFTLDSFFVELNFALMNNKEWAIGVADVRFEPKTMDLYFGINAKFYKSNRNWSATNPFKFECKLPKDYSLPDPLRTVYKASDIGNSNGAGTGYITSLFLTPLNRNKLKHLGAALPETWLLDSPAVVFVASLSAMTEWASGKYYVNYACYVCPEMKQFMIVAHERYGKYGDDLNGTGSLTPAGIPYGLPMVYKTNGVWSYALSNYDDIMKYIADTEAENEYSSRVNDGFPINTVLMCVASVAATVGSVYGIVPPGVTASLWKESIGGVVNLAKGGSDLSMRQMLSKSLDITASIIQSNGSELLNQASAVIPKDIKDNASALFEGGKSLANSFESLTKDKQDVLTGFISSYMSDEKYKMARQLGLTGDLTGLESTKQVYSGNAITREKVKAVARLFNSEWGK